MLGASAVEGTVGCIPQAAFQIQPRSSRQVVAKLKPSLVEVFFKDAPLGFKLAMIFFLLEYTLQQIGICSVLMSETPALLTRTQHD